MVTYVEGNIFDSPAQVITNTVNCVGVMGKGLALQFKNKFPMMFEDYQKRCQSSQVELGKPYLWEDDRSQVLNFPTKGKWQEKSKLSDIEDGLKYLADNYAQMGLQSVALPPLGCGLGGLSWLDVKPLIETHFGSIPDLEVYVYAPKEASSQKGSDESEENKSSASSQRLVARPEL